MRAEIESDVQKGIWTRFTTWLFGPETSQISAQGPNANAGLTGIEQARFAELREELKPPEQNY